MLIQAILLATFLSFLIFLTRQPGLGRTLRTGLAIVTLLACYVVAFPAITNAFAAFAGVGRGVDLIIYLSISAIALLIAALYIRSRSYELRTARLIQQLAIQNYRIEELERQAPARRT